ncbi:MAG: T9SS type A sorting domain-containing protein [Chlorobi bacterium]|nr:T9SS type A sorting domain-containing protein [Chlorobiota bacterium]
MKKYLFFLAIFANIGLFGQNQAPVAVNDTVFTPVKLGDYVTINVLQNDYDPDGDSIFILSSGGVGTIMDSTITFYINPHSDWNWEVGEIYRNYSISDTNSNTAEATIVIQLDKSWYEYLDINNIKARFNANGNHFWDFNNNKEYFYPSESETGTIWNFAFWLGGLDESGDLRVAAERYRQIGTDYWTGPVSTDGNATTDSATVLQWRNIWKLNKDEIAYHLEHWADPGYEPIEDIATWPAHGDTALGQSYNLAPYIDVNTNGVYEPLSGDYPLIRGDQTLFFIINDQKQHSETGGLPIGIEIHGFAYAFDAPDNPALNNTTFLSYKIFNRSQHTLTDAYAGTFTDLDLGYAWDDFVGCDVERGAYYAYNGDDFDDPDITWQGDTIPQYGENPPAQGVIILGGPYIDPDGIDNPADECDESINGVGFGDGIIDNERFGMSNFVYFNNSQNPTGDPEVYYEYYNYMKSIWKDSTAMEYGGNGHVSSGAYGPAAKFMFPGLSDPCNWGTGGEEPYGPIDWTEQTAGNEPGDRRGMCSMGPFTLEAGSFHKVDIAFVTAPGDENTNSVDRLMTYIDSVKTFYYQDPDHFGFAWMGSDETEIKNTEFLIYPNPASYELFVQFEDIQKNTFIEIYDLYGKMVKQIKVANSELSKINISNLEQGIYVLRVKSLSGMISRKFLVK